jgi:hypothetical protein
MTPFSDLPSEIVRHFRIEGKKRASERLPILPSILRANCILAECVLASTQLDIPKAQAGHLNYPCRFRDKYGAACPSKIA